MSALGRIFRSISSLFRPAQVTTASALPRPDPRAAGRDLRALFLRTEGSALGLAPDSEFPHVFGIAMDWSIGEETATIAAVRDGTASLYTTSTFGILGGSGHESVRAAARRFVKLAGAFYEDGVPASEFEYPSSDTVYFFLRTFDGVRALAADVEQIRTGASPYTGLFAAGQDVLTELRKVTERRP